MKAAEDMALSQFLRTCFGRDVVNKKRLYTGFHMGLVFTSHLTTDLVPPSAAMAFPVQCVERI